MADTEGAGAGHTVAGMTHRGEIPEHHHQDRVEVKVNNRPVRFDERHVTGQQIIDAAITQGVEIKRDFVLSREIEPGKYKIIGADEHIKVHEGECFRANAPDDNS
jgi:hypothetical protein